MANFRLWVHEQVSKLDHEHVHRHFPVIVTGLLLALVFGAPAYHFAKALTGPELLVTSATDTGNGNAILEARITDASLAQLTFFVTDDKGLSVEVPGAGGPTDWKAETALDAGKYAVSASGLDGKGVRFSSTSSVTLVMEPAGTSGNTSTTATLTMTTFAPEAAGSNFMILKALSDQPLTDVLFTVSGANNSSFPITALDSTGVGTFWTGSVQLPFGTTYTASANGRDAVGNTVISTSLKYLLEGSTAPPSSTTVDMKDARLSSSGVPNRVLMEAVSSGDSPASLVFKVTSVNYSQNFIASRDASDVWKAVADFPFGATYHIVATAKLADGTTVISTTFKDITVPADTSGTDATSPTSDSTTPPPDTTDILRLEITSPQAGQTFSGLVTLAAKVSVPDAFSVTFFVKDTTTGKETTIEGVPSRDLQVWNALFTPTVSAPLDIRARAKLSDGTLILSDTVSFSVALSQETSTTEPLPPAPETTTESPLPSSDEPVIEEPLLEESASETLTEEERISLEQERLEAERDERLRIEQALLESTATSTEPLPLSEDQVRTDQPDFMTLSDEEKKRLEEERLRKLRELESIKSTVPVLAKNTDEQVQALSREAFMKDNATELATLADECRTSNISKDRCAAWLKARYQAKACLSSGAITKETCEAFIRTTEKRELDPRELLGIASSDELDAMRNETRPFFNSSFSTDELPDETKSVMAAVPIGTRKVRMIEPAQSDSTTRVASPGIWTFDTDGDGLSDDAEKRYGTDPENEDSDADGYLDGEEVRGGFNPLGEGRLERRTTGIEKALLDGVPIEEPRLSDKIDSHIRVETALSVPIDETDAKDDSVVRLAGIAAPNSLISLFIYTYLPVVVTTTTDADGNWNYDFSSKLAEGSHEAYVSVNDDTGKVIARSEPLSFLVQTAQAVSEEAFLAGDVNVVEPVATYTRYFIGGGIALILLALGTVVMIVRRTGSKEPTLTEIE